MALLFFDGFDLAQASPLILKPGWAAPGVSPSLTTGRTGAGNCISPANGYNMKLTLPSAASTVIIGTAAKASPVTFGDTTGSVIRLFGDNGATTHLSINWDANGHLLVRRGTASGTIIATSTQAWPSDSSWHYLEVKATIADTGGTCVIRVDGDVWINFTGDTKNAGTNNSVDAVAILNPSGGGITWDDFYVCDATGTSNNDFLGDIKIEALLPTGDGASSQWVGTDGDSLSNYALVDENPANTTDYVASSTIGNRDLYAMADLSTASATVLALQTSVYAEKSDAGAASAKTLTRGSSGTVAASNAIALSTSWAMASGPIRTTDPDGAAWTVASVNAAQAGVETA